MSAVTDSRFGEQDLRAQARKQKRILVPAFSGAIAGLFGYMILLGLVRRPLLSTVEEYFGQGAGDFVLVTLLVGGFIAIFLVPIVMASTVAGRYVPGCPKCQHPLRDVEAAISTKLCPACHAQIVVAARTHSYATFYRAKRIAGRRFLSYWLWALTLLSILVLGCWWPPSSSREATIVLVPLIATVGAGYCWLRTFDRRYLGPFLVSTTLLAIFAYLVWREW